MTSYSNTPKPNLPTKAENILAHTPSKLKKMAKELIEIAKEGEKIRNSYLEKDNDRTACYL
jgi:hypothetical protein